jgi:hypothetical protein
LVEVIGTLTASNVTFDNNYNSNRGGAVGVAGVAYLDHILYKQNNAYNSRGADIFVLSTGELYEEDIVSEGVGGGLVAADTQCASGGHIGVTGGYASVKRAVAYGQRIRWNGGFIFADSGALAELEDISVTNTMTSRTGGALAAVSDVLACS